MPPEVNDEAVEEETKPGSEVNETPEADQEEKSQDVEKGKTDFRAEFFKQKKELEVVREEKSALEVALENNTNALEGLKAGKKEEAPEEEEPDADTDWLKGLLDSDEEPVEGKAKPLDEAKLVETLEKLVNTKLNQREERWNRTTEVSKEMEQVDNFLKSAFTDDVERGKAREHIYKKALDTGFSATKLAMTEFPNKFLDLMEVDITKKVEERIKKETMAKMADVGGDSLLQRMGYSEAQPNPLAQEDIANAKFLDEHPDFLRSI